MTLMDEREFVANRQDSWNRLQALIGKASVRGGLRALAGDEVRELGPLYRRAASDLAYARSHPVSPALVAHLNHLVARGYALLYRSDSRSWAGIPAFFSRDLPQTFRRRLPFFLAAVVFLGLGGMAGYFLVLHNRQNIDIFIPPGSMFRKSLEYWESGQTAHGIQDASAAEQSSFLMQNNIRVSLLAFAVGIFGGVFTAFITFYNGAMLGALAGVMTHVHQHASFWPGILPHGVVELSETCLAAAAGLSLGWAVLAPGLYSRKDALALAARDSIKLIIGGIVMLIFAGLVEAFLSHSLLPAPLKVIFGIASGLALYSYLFLAGREGDSTDVIRPERSEF